MQDNKTNRDKLYTFLTNKGVTGIGADREEFETIFEDEGKQKKLYDFCVNKGYTGIGKNYDEFAEGFSVQKGANGAVATILEQASGIPYPAPEVDKSQYTFTAEQLGLEDPAESPENPVKSPEGNEYRYTGIGKDYKIEPTMKEQFGKEGLLNQSAEEYMTDVQKNIDSRKAGMDFEKLRQEQGINAGRSNVVKKEGRYYTEAGSFDNYSQAAYEVDMAKEYNGVPMREIAEYYSLDENKRADYAKSIGRTPEEIEKAYESKEKGDINNQMSDLYGRIDAGIREVNQKKSALQSQYEKERGFGGFITDALMSGAEAELPVLQGQLPGSALEGSREWQNLDKQEKMLWASARQFNTAQKIINAAKSGDFFTGIGDALQDLVLGGSAQDMQDLAAINEVSRKFEKGEKLTAKEEMLLESIAMNVAVASQYKDELSAWYNAGNMVGEMIPYMVEMWMNPLSKLGKKFGQKVLDRAKEKYGKDLAKHFVSTKIKTGAAKLGGAALGGYGMSLTTGLPSVITGVQERTLGDAVIDKEMSGDVKYAGRRDAEGLGTAIYKETTQKMLDNASEMLGAGYANMPFKWLQKVGKGTKVLGWIDNLANSKFGKGVSQFAEKTKWHGPIEEFLEEVHVGLLNPVLGGDQSWGEFFTADNLATIAIGVAVPGAVISTANTIAGAADGAFKVGAQERWKMKNAEAMGYQLWQDNPNEWNDLTRSLMVDQMEDIEKTLKEVYNNPNLTPEQKKTALEYGVYSLQWRTARGVEEAFNEGKKFIDPMLRDVYGTAYAERISPVQANNAYKAMAEAEKNAQRVLGIGDRSVDEWLGGRSAEEVTNNPARQEAIKAYQAAKLDFEGRRDRYIAEKERAYMESDKSIQANDNNGMVYATQLKNEPVYITGGNVVLYEDGTIDVNNSSETLYVKFPDGHVEMTSPDKFTEVFTSDRTADLKAAKRAEINAKWKAEFDTAEAQSIEQEKRDSGVVFNMTDAQGEHRIEILNEGEKMSDILIDGKQEQIPTEELNRWKQEAGIQSTDAVADDATDNVAPTGDNVAPVETVEMPEVPDFFRLNGKNYEVASRNADGSVDVVIDGKRETLPAGTDYSTSMPTDKKGDVQYEQMPVERTHEHFVQKVTDDESRALMIEGRRKKAEAERKKFDKKPDPGLDPDKWAEVNRKWEEGKKAAQAKVDYWNEVAKREAEITRSETREAVENIKPDVVKETAEEFIASHLPKITPESFKRETGLSNEEQSKLVGVISNEGVTIEQAAESIMENYDSELKALGFTGDMQDVRNVIIDVLSQGNPRSYTKNSREAREAENIEQQRAEAEAWAMGTFNMTLEELYVYEETLLPRLTREFEGFDEKEYYDNLAENYENDTTRESESIGRGGEVLQGEQSVPASGAPAVGVRNEGGAVSNDVQGGGQNGVAQEEAINEPVGNSEQLSSSEIPNNQSVAEGNAPGQSGVYADNQGNPVDADGKLIVDEVNSIDEITDEDFETPTRNVQLPAIPENVANAIGTNGRPVVIKRNVFEKNGNTHVELEPEDSRNILRSALYNPNLVGSTQPIRRPDYKVAIKTGEQNAVVVLDVYQEKDFVEIVGWRMVNEKGLAKMQRQAEREGGQFLILSPNDGSAAALSALPLGLSSASEDRNSVSNPQENTQKSGEIAENGGEKMYLPEELAEAKEQLGELNATSAPEFAARLFSIKPWKTLEEANAALKELLASYGETLNGQSLAVIPFLEKAQGLIREYNKSQEPRSVEEMLDNGDKRITNYNSRGEVATVAIERDGKMVSVDSYDEGVLFEHTEYDGNGKAKSVTRYDKQGNVVGTQKYENGKAKTPMQKLADRILDRTEEKRRIPLRERARKLEAQVGVKANIIESFNEVKNREARKRIAAGEAVAGWYSGGQVYLYMPNIKDRREIELTYVHEVVAHHGVKKLLGDRFNEFLDGVWNMMSEADRARMLAYVGAKENPTLQDMRAAADEYVAELAEKMNLGELEQSAWDKIVDWFKELLENIGFENLTKEDIESVLKASYANLAKGENGDAEIKDRTMFRISRTSQEFDATQAEAVEKRGIVAPGLNEAVVNVVDVPRHDFTGNLKEARAKAKKWAIENYTGKEFDLPENAGKYVISKNAIGKYLDKSAFDKSENAAVHLSVLKELPNVISNSIETEIHADYSKGDNGERSAENGVNRNDLLVHRIYGAVNIDGKTYRVKTTIHEFRDANTANTPHSYEVTKIELIEDSTVTPNDGINNPLNRSVNSISATKLLEGVEKSYDKGKKVLDESENSSENPQDAESGIRFRKKDSERRQEKRRINDAIDTAAGFVTVGGKKQATKNRLKKEAERKQLAKEMYSSVLKGDFNDVTLAQIDKFIEDATPANPFGRRISQRLPQRMERALRQGARTNAVDALFSRISESAVPANERFSEAGRREIEERKKELLKGWAIATGNWHTDLKEFTDDTEPIGEGKDSKVYSSKDGRYVIKASKGKPYSKRFRPDIDNIALFNDVFRDTRYEILGYGEIDGEFVRILQQPIVDFAESTPLTSEERREYMQSLGFEPLNDANTAFADGEIVIADLQKGNVVRDAAGNISVIDADAKLHTKDVGGDYTYPPVEDDLPEDSGIRFRITPEMDAEYMDAVEDGDISYDEAVHEAKIFEEIHKGSAPIIVLDGIDNWESEFIKAGVKKDEIERFRERLKRSSGNPKAVYLDDADLIFIFNPKVARKEFNGYIWHEDMHKAIREDDRFNRDIAERIINTVVPGGYQEVIEYLNKHGYEGLAADEEALCQILQSFYINGAVGRKGLKGKGVIQDYFNPLIDKVYGRREGRNSNLGNRSVQSATHGTDETEYDGRALATPVEQRTGRESETETQATGGAEETRFSIREESQGTSGIDDVPTQPLTLMERITNSLLEVSAKNKENLGLRADALKAFGKDINRVLSAMKVQRVYDKFTVDTLVKLAKMYFKNAQLLGEVTPYEVARIMGVLNRSVGKRDVSSEAAKLMDILLDAHTNALAGILEKAEKVKAKKVNAAGVEVMGRLDKYGQISVDEYRTGKEMTPEKLEEAIFDSDNRLAELEQNVREALGLPEGDVDQAARDYTGDNDVVDVYLDERARLEGLMLARDYKESVQHNLDEIKDLKQELKKAEQDYRLGNINSDSLKEFRKSASEAILQSKAELIEGYHDLIYKFQEGVKKSSQRANAFVQAQINRAREIQHNANSDMEGIEADSQGKHPERFNNSVTRTLMSPMPTFQGMLKKFGEKNVEGKGYLYERFMPQATKASDNEFRGKVAARVMIETKLKEIYGEDMDLGKFMKSLREPGITVTYREGNKMKEFELTQGQMLYIYMVNKMSDGQMKLRRMGITDDVVAELMTKLPEDTIRFADWVQNELLKDLRGKYNAVHERVFGAPMAAIDNYFPIKIRKEARGEKGDVSEIGQEGKPSTITGSIIKRTKNAIAIDLSADAMQVLMEHIDDMEHWAAFAEFNRDINTLLNYRHFQNQVKNMTSLRYGSGEEMWKNFQKTAKIVSGTYKSSDSRIDKAVLNIVKGLTRAKINFRGYTAVKQLLSAPAFWTDAGVKELSYCYVNPKGCWNWAKENLPGFAERWEGRTMGNEKLLKSDSDWEVWRNEFVEAATRWGMTPNAAIDALTVAQGARAVYMTKLKQFKKAGYTEKRANEKALQAAAEAYNESQQSSEGMYLSPLQVEGTALAAVFTTFKNSNFGYSRKVAQSVANVRRKMRNGYKEEAIAFMTKQMVRDGLSEDNAKKMAEKVYKKSWYKDIANVAMFGFALPALWTWGGYAIYMILGDDDEEKEKMKEEIALRGALGFLDGIPLGESVISAINAVKEGDSKYFRLPELIAVGDLRNLAQVLNYDAVRGANDVINIVTAMGVGVSPQILTDFLVAISEIKDFSLEEFGMFTARVMSAPQSNLDALMVDDAMENSAHNLADIAERYIQFKTKRNAPITQFFYSDETEQKVIERYAGRFASMLEDNFENVVDDNNAYDLFYDSASPEVKEVLASYRKKFLAGDKADDFQKKSIKRLVLDLLEFKSTEYSVYWNMTNPEDEETAFLIESELNRLEPIKKGEKDADNLSEYKKLFKKELNLYKKLNKALRDVNKYKRKMQKSPDTRERSMTKIREERAEAIELINNYRNNE